MRAPRLSGPFRTHHHGCEPCLLFGWWIGEEGKDGGREGRFLSRVRGVVLALLAAVRDPREEWFVRLTPTLQGSEVLSRISLERRRPRGRHRRRGRRLATRRRRSGRRCRQSDDGRLFHRAADTWIIAAIHPYSFRFSLTVRARLPARSPTRLKRSKTFRKLKNKTPQQKRQSLSLAPPAEGREPWPAAETAPSAWRGGLASARRSARASVRNEGEGSDHQPLSPARQPFLSSQSPASHVYFIDPHPTGALYGTYEAFKNKVRPRPPRLRRRWVATRASESARRCRRGRSLAVSLLTQNPHPNNRSRASTRSGSSGRTP